MAPDKTPQSVAIASDGHWGGASRNPDRARTPKVSKPNFVRFMVSATGLSWLTVLLASTRLSVGGVMVEEDGRGVTDDFPSGGYPK